MVLFRIIVENLVSRGANMKIDMLDLFISLIFEHGVMSPQADCSK